MVLFNKGGLIMWHEWFFDGIGTAILTFIAGLITGGAGGAAITRRVLKAKNIKAENNSDVNIAGRDINNHGG